jgi:hypothetical protein
LAATVRIMRWTSLASNPSKSIIDGSVNRAGTVDDPVPGTSWPIPVPTSASSNYSYWVCTRLSATAAATTAIQNIKWYTDSQNNLGVGVSLNVATASAYVQAIGTTAVSGSALTSANYGSSWSYSNASANDAFAYTSSNLLSVGGSIGSTTGDIGHFVVYQVAVASTAGPGTTGSEQLTWQYDET